jgi:ketosteroid isomerase-like protein
VSSANLELSRRGLEAFNQRDVEGVLATLDPDVELIPLRAVLEGRRYSGHEGFRTYLADVDEDWDEFTVEPDEFRELDGERVLTLGRIHARGRGSGVEVDYPAAWISEIRAGKVVRLQFYSDEAHALAATGPLDS